MVITRGTLIISDAVFAVTVVAINYANDGGFVKAPAVLKFLVVVAFATCMVRHINYYRIHKRIY